MGPRLYIVVPLRGAWVPGPLRFSLQCSVLLSVSRIHVAAEQGDSSPRHQGLGGAVPTAVPSAGPWGPTVTDGGCALPSPSVTPQLGTGHNHACSAHTLMGTRAHHPPTPWAEDGWVGDQVGNREREEVNTWAGSSDLGAGRCWILQSHRGQPLRWLRAPRGHTGGSSPGSW